VGHGFGKDPDSIRKGRSENIALACGALCDGSLSR